MKSKESFNRNPPPSTTLFLRSGRREGFCKDPEKPSTLAQLFEIQPEKIVEIEKPSLLKRLWDFLKFWKR